MYEAYRVMRTFQWRGWQYAPQGQCECSKSEHTVSHFDQKQKKEVFETRSGCVDGCTGQNGTGCTKCNPSFCRCACHIPEEVFGGDIWIVEAGHSRKETMITQRFVIGDASIPPVDELLKDEKYKRLLSLPKPLARSKKK